jgi:hypothetical protein
MKERGVPKKGSIMFWIHKTACHFYGICKEPTEEQLWDWFHENKKIVCHFCGKQILS